MDAFLQSHEPLAFNNQSKPPNDEISLETRRNRIIIIGKKIILTLSILNSNSLYSHCIRINSPYQLSLSSHFNRFNLHDLILHVAGLLMAYGLTHHSTLSTI